jgi:putative transposase
MTKRNSPEAIEMRSLKQIRHGRHCVFKNFVHLVFVTKYRRDVLTEPMLKRIEELMKETCEQMECELIEFNGEDDHVHLMVSVHPKVPVSSLVGKLKGKSAYFLRQEFAREVKKKALGRTFLESFVLHSLLRRSTPRDGKKIY